MTTSTIAPANYTIDPSHSRIGFVARHAMITKVRGSFNDFAGSFNVAPDLADSTAEITINVSSIDTRNADRDQHLRSNDFFDMDTYPTIKFVATSFADQGNGRFAVTGDLTIKATTKPVTLELDFTGEATDPFGNARIGFEGSTVINRRDWGVEWNAALETGGVLVGENVTLEFEISALKAV